MLDASDAARVSFAVRCMRTKHKWLAVVLVAVAALALGGFYFSPRDPFFHRRSFAADKWAHGDMRVRGQMVQDLVSKKLLDSKTRPEVEALLGPPDSTSTNSVEYRVDIGMRFMGRRWGYRLVVHFEEQANKVRDVLLID
jgi:hypothetical protein